jgi:hypothetical protein
VSENRAQRGDPPVAGIWRHRFHGPLASGGIPKTSWAVRGCTPLWFSLSARLGQRASNTTCIEVFCVDRRTRLLAPGLIEATGINTIESKLIDKLQYDGFSCAVIACYGQGDRPGVPLGRPNSIRCRA